MYCKTVFLRPSRTVHCIFCPCRTVELYLFFLVKHLVNNLVKNLVEALVKNLAKNLVKTTFQALRLLMNNFKVDGLTRALSRQL